MDSPTDDENTTPPVPPVPPPPPAPAAGGPPEPAASAPPVPPVPPIPAAPGTGAPRIALGQDGVAGVAPPAGSTPFWKRIPLKFAIIGVIVAGIAIAGFISSRGKTNAEDLKVGDCFELPSDGLITDVKDESCDGLHTTEIYAEPKLGESASWPGLDVLGTSADGAGAACTTAAEALTLNLENIPEDTLDGVFYPELDSWNDGDRKILCYVSSETGFPGPVVAR